MSAGARVLILWQNYFCLKRNFELKTKHARYHHHNFKVLSVATRPSTGN